MQIELEDSSQPFAVSLTQALVRVVLAAIALAHGADKLLHASAFALQLTEAGLSEAETITVVLYASNLAAALGLFLGRFTRLSALVLAFDVALSGVLGWLHGELWLAFDQLAQLEAPALTVACCFFFVIVGSGPIGLDYELRRRNRLRALINDELWSRPPYVRAEPR